MYSATVCVRVCLPTNSHSISSDSYLQLQPSPHEYMYPLGLAIYWAEFRGMRGVHTSLALQALLITMPSIETVDMKIQKAHARRVFAGFAVVLAPHTSSFLTAHFAPRVARRARSLSRAKELLWRILFFLRSTRWLRPQVALRVVAQVRLLV